ncbi:unnamed protein product [Prorocentrum cordatum]|uniref:Uncharacterized protein n=1 Tax=Prorocentrum cordatum TaxID=2364126 RepID=A0ABN9VM00_9DINO|nr:unnamed protein product [Polarella glacialis]
MAAARVCENQDMQDTQNIQEFCGTIRKPLPGPLFGQHRGQALCAAGHRAPRAQPPAEKMPRHCLMCAAARRGRSRQKEKMARPRATQAAPVPRRENLRLRPTAQVRWRDGPKASRCHDTTANSCRPRGSSEPGARLPPPLHQPRRVERARDGTAGGPAPTRSTSESLQPSRCHK